MLVVHYEGSGWFDPHEDQGSRGIVTKRLVAGDGGFWAQTSKMPPGTRIAPHVHSASEILIVLEGGCQLDTGEVLVSNDCAVLDAGTAYGFTVGPAGIRLMVIRAQPAELTYVE